AGLSLSELTRFNPQLGANRTPPGFDNRSAWRVHLPLGKGAHTSARLIAEAEGAVGLKRYVARFGDTLHAIAADHGTSVRRLSQLNSLPQSARLAEGSRLLVPSRPAGAAPTRQRRLVALSSQS